MQLALHVTGEGGSGEVPVGIVSLERRCKRRSYLGQERDRLDRRRFRPIRQFGIAADLDHHRKNPDIGLVAFDDEFDLAQQFEGCGRAEVFEITVIDNAEFTFQTLSGQVFP